MNTHFTLLVGARAALLLQHFGKEEDKAWIFPADGPVFYDTMAKALKERPAASLRVIFDCKSLDLRRETLPPVDPMRRHKIIKQQLSHHFPKSLLRGSGSWREGASFQALHAACSPEPQLELLLQHLHKLPSQVEYLSFFAAEWADHATEAHVPLPRPWGIAMILTEALGLRQIVLKDGMPAFTRLHEECAPSHGATILAPQIIEHLRSTRDYLPRLEAGAPKDVPAMLFVPSCLESLSSNEQLRALDCRVAALKSPHAALLPPEWEADLSWISQVAMQKLPLVPLVPFWMKERATSNRIRKIIAMLLMGFGLAGIYIGSDIMFGKKPAPPPPAPVVEAPPVPLAKAPELKLEALIYNGGEDWSVWVSGQKFTFAEPVIGNLRVVHISGEGVTLRWEEGGQSKDYNLEAKDAAGR
jgi:hypothetical protein